MGRYRVSIAGLMAVMITVAIGLGALREGTQLWVDIVFNLVVASLLFATYKARCSRGIAAARWAGFAAFGWAHRVLGLIGMPWGPHYGVSPHLVTMEVAERVWVYLAPDTSAAAGQVVIARFLVVHSVLSLLLALIGAMTIGWFADRGVAMESTGRASPPASPASPPR